MTIQTTTFKGARYIVKFHDPLEWAVTESYEAIEAVMHNAYTYISKQPVPAGVQITNEDFWLLWADPNAQMEQLRQLVSGYVDDVEELSGDVGELDTRVTSIETYVNSDDLNHAVFIGDSYLRGTGTTDGPSGGEGYNSIGNGWGKYFLTRERGLQAQNVMCIAGGSGGFVHLGTNGGGLGLTFSGMLQRAHDLMSSDDIAKTRYVIICGGINDGNDITMSAVVNTLDLARSLFPKTPIYVFTNIGTRMNVRTLNTAQAFAYSVIKKACAKCGCSYFEMWPIFLNAPDTVIATDNVHPTDNGYREFARGMYAQMLGGKIGTSYIDDCGYIDITPANTNVTFSFPLFYASDCHVILSGGTAVLNSSFTVTSQSPTDIGEIPAALAPRLLIVDQGWVNFSYTHGGETHTYQGLITVEITTAGKIRVRRPFVSVGDALPINQAAGIEAGATINLPKIEWDIF